MFLVKDNSQIPKIFPAALIGREILLNNRYAKSVMQLKYTAI